MSETTRGSGSYTDRAFVAVTEAVGEEHDFDGWLAGALATAAAELGSAAALVAGRPGSWEADLIQRLVCRTVGWDDEYLSGTERRRPRTSSNDRHGSNPLGLVLMRAQGDPPAGVRTRLAARGSRPTAGDPLTGRLAERTRMLRFVSEDDHLAAAKDAAYDRFREVAVECAECGTLYDQEYHPATRSEPAYIERGDCPNCGFGEI